MTPVERAVETYVRAWNERDAAARLALLEQCWADDARFVMRTREVRGRSAMSDFMARTLADPTLVTLRLAAPADAMGMTFRFRAVGDLTGGKTTPETLETGLIDADGRISLVLTFTPSI